MVRRQLLKNLKSRSLDVKLVSQFRRILLKPVSQFRRILLKPLGRTTIGCPLYFRLKSKDAKKLQN
jgi:hypothetical protein